MLWSSGIIFIVQFITLLVTCLLCRNIVNLKSDFQCWEMTVKWYFQAKYWMIYRVTTKSWFRKKTWTPQVDRDLIFKTQGKRIWLPWRWLCTGKFLSYRYWRSRATVQKVAPKSNIFSALSYSKYNHWRHCVYCCRSQCEIINKVIFMTHYLWLIVTWWVFKTV